MTLRYLLEWLGTVWWDQAMKNRYGPRKERNNVPAGNCDLVSGLGGVLREGRK